MYRRQILDTLYFLALAVFLFCSSNASAGSSFEGRLHEGHLCSRNSKWHLAREFTLSMDAKEAQAKCSFTLKMWENGDAYLKRVGMADGEKSDESMIVAGRALLTKDSEIEENYAIDIPDSAALFQRLTLALIDLASDKGPLNTSFPLHAIIKEAKYPINVTTPSAGGSYSAPWKADIELTKDDRNIIHYKIDFSFTSKKGKSVGMKLIGQISNYGETNTEQPLRDDLNIAGWKQYNIGPYTKNVAGGTIADFGTTYIKPPLPTLGLLRKYLREKETKKDVGHNE